MKPFATREDRQTFTSAIGSGDTPNVLKDTFAKFETATAGFKAGTS